MAQDPQITQAQAQLQALAQQQAVYQKSLLNPPERRYGFPPPSEQAFQIYQQAQSQIQQIGRAREQLKSEVSQYQKEQQVLK